MVRYIFSVFFRSQMDWPVWTMDFLGVHSLDTKHTTIVQTDEEKASINYNVIEKQCN